MALAITEEHRSLADSVRAVLGDTDALGDARRALEGQLTGPPGYWRNAGELGWFGLHLAEQDGGAGAGLLEAVVVIAELGAAVAPGTALADMIVSATIQATAPASVRAALLPGLAAGTTRTALALGADIAAADGRLTGTGTVLGSADATLLLVAVGDDVVLVTGSDQFVLAPVKDTFDPSFPLLRLQCDNSRAATVLTGGRRQLRRLSWLFAAAEAAGAMAACLRRTVEYVQVREQFGRPVGSFMAVKHHCADMLIATELATAAVWDAARGASDDSTTDDSTTDDSASAADDSAADESTLTAAVAATMTLAPYVRIAQQAIQLHGGVGYTWEHDAHLYYRRATALAAFFGPVEHSAREVLDLRAAGHSHGAGFDLPAEADTYRRQAREFWAAYTAATARDRQRVAARAGYVVPHWPKPYGRGADPVEQLVIEDELPDLPRQTLGLGEWVLPTILQHGTDEQRERLLWPSLEGTLRWCQLFSEPGAGSDAAAVTTRARPTAGGWLVTGQKVWTSDAHNCQRGLATVRTDPAAPKHKGITAMIIDMAAPGVEIRPLREITGETMFNEVFLDDVFVPDSDVVGMVNGGWRVARATLANERLSIGGNPVTLEAAALLDLLSRYTAVDDGVLREAGLLLSESQTLHALNLQQIDRALAGAEPGPEGNIAKIVVGEHSQRIVNLGMRVAGLAGVLGEEPTWAHDYLFTRCLTIAGGTSEIVRTQIAESLLGLPREPQAPAGSSRARGGTS
ncbi:acyl-CoA dehydrogenase [Frankia sp. AiPs1]|uniref:acyl-CoA dehydrogenase n=1 Tax=Frankia sp. AiPs1 TaxID=573493 RepID=UPI00204425D0|nr:acyl-CoA dehydrogenase [Frankia sp. AiPs1]MCM3920853.1 acyl-CoA dehydrogenase [Frankia sp. AiPs1]